MKPKLITFFGNFGTQNLGNECTLQAIIYNTLKRLPDAKLQCLCTVPEDTVARHNIPAFRFDCGVAGLGNGLFETLPDAALRADGRKQVLCKVDPSRSPLPKPGRARHGP
jgi:Uncharacterized conserved protein